MSSDESLRMTGQEGWSFLAGSANTLEMTSWMGIVASWAEISPLAPAASRQGRIISLKTISGSAEAGVEEVVGSPKIWREVAQAHCK
jgi:hypothetical protein